MVATRQMKRPRRGRDLRTTALYVFTVLRTFRWTLIALNAALLLGAVLYWITPIPQFGGHLSVWNSFYASWMSMLAQQMMPPPAPRYLEIVSGLYPLLGFVLVSDGVVRLSMLMISKAQGEKEWMKVMATTYRNHVILCGLGHLGYRILGQLLDNGTPVVQALPASATAKAFRDIAERLADRVTTELFAQGGGSAPVEAPKRLPILR